jgi:tRNA nucleotidyltransferase/poly(A) polymerase
MAINKTNLVKLLQELNISTTLSEQVRQKFEITLPTDLETLSDIFKSSGKDFYLVGGSVRDALLGKTPKDFDVTTNATPDEVEEILKAYPEYRVLELGRAFGIVKIITPEGNDYEIATFRTDIGKGRRPDSVEFATIEKDVNRRDLTMNALFYDISNKEIVDYVGGIQDIENKVVKTVGNAKERFDEDRLRILRALRFAARFGTKLDKEADEAISDDNSLEGVSGERIRDEFLKGIKSAISPISFYQLIERYNLWEQIFPGLVVNKEYSEISDIPVALALLLQNNDAKAVAIKLNKAKYTGDEIRQVQFLLDFKNVSPETALKLKKIYKISGLKDASLKYFAEALGISNKTIQSFLEYEPTVSSNEFPELSGRELGIAIANREKEKFEEMLKENKTNLEKLMESLFSEEVDEMAIRQFKTVGDWGRRSSFGDVDRKILTSPRGVEKIKRQWEKTPFDFDMYLVNDPRVNNKFTKFQFREVGLVDMSFVRDNMKLTADEIPDPDGNTITIIYTSNTGAERYMSSGWILAHRLGHALARGRGFPAEKWQEFIKDLRKRIADILKEVYGIDVYSKTYDFQGNAGRDKILKYVAQQLGTMKSARDNKMRNWYEFAYELLAQYLLTGKITFNPLPQSIITGIAGWGRKQTRYSKDEEAREAINTSELESIALEIEGDLETILGASIGKVFVM